MGKKILSGFCLLLYIATATAGAFSGGLWAAFGIGGALILFIGTWIADKEIPLPSRNFTLFTLAALGIFAGELLLSSHLEISAHVWINLVSIFVPLLLLTSPRVQGIAYSPSFPVAVSLAMMFGAVALGLELNSGGAFLHMFKKPDAFLTEYNRGIAHLVILSFPVFAALWVEGHKRETIALALLLLFPACLTESHTAKLALIIGGIGTLSGFCRSKWVERGLAGISVLMLGFPFYAQMIFAANYDAVERWHDSWRHRMEIWDYLSYRILDRPLFGWGLGTTHTLDFIDPHGDWYEMVKTAAPHAHNFITELWVETGAIGLACGLGFLLISLRAAGNLDQKLRPFALGGWATAVAVSMFGFDFWTDALWGAFALSAFAFGMLQQHSERSQDSISA